MVSFKFCKYNTIFNWNHLRYDANPSLELQKNPSTILVQRSDMKDGFACHGDSGGPFVVKSNGRFVQVAVAYSVPDIQELYSWPPPCYCSWGMMPELHMRVSSALPWIYENVKERNLRVPCQI